MVWDIQYRYNVVMARDCSVKILVYSVRQMVAGDVHVMTVLHAMVSSSMNMTICLRMCLLCQIVCFTAWDIISG